MKSWIEVPAFIQQTNLEESSDSESTTYKVTAAYSYTYKDRSYTGNRVSMHSGSDNIGSFHKRTYSQLTKYKNSGEPFRCYINPANPSESILFRTPRLEKLGFYMIFTLIFGGVRCYSRNRHKTAGRTVEVTVSDRTMALENTMERRDNPFTIKIKVNSFDYICFILELSLVSDIVHHTG